jgi:hypothetical protein
VGGLTNQYVNGAARLIKAAVSWHLKAQYESNWSKYFFRSPSPSSYSRHLRTAAAYRSNTSAGGPAGSSSYLAISAHAAVSS